MNQPKPNPAKEARNRIVAAIREQQGVIETQASRLETQGEEITALRSAVATLAVAAGVGNHPRFAGLVRQAGLTVRADAETNQGDSIGATPDTTTEQAKKPDATDDVESIGAAPGSANKGVTPEGVTDVNNSDVVSNPPVLDNLQNVTAPVSGTDAVDPRASDQGANRVTTGTPSNEGSGTDVTWKGSSLGSEQERFVASMRLARLRLEAGLDSGEDLALAQRIASTDTPLGEITAQVEALSAVASRAAAAPTAEQRRRLVPQGTTASRGIAPVSLQATAATTARPGDDEWMVGGIEG